MSSNILFLALSGIGNLLMQLPALEAAKKAWPDSKITVWVAPRGTKIIAEHCSFIDEVIEGKTRRSVLGHLHFVSRLRRHNPEMAIMLSPGQLLKGAGYMFLSGATVRVGHRYPYLGNPGSPFLLSHAIPEEPGLHDIEQNLNLVASLGVNVDAWRNKPYHFPSVPPQPRPPHQLIIGIHAGSAPEFSWKRWPLENFAHVGRTLATNHHAHILIFGGPAEVEQSKELRTLIGKAHTTLITSDLLSVAGLIKQCDIFLSNDSGLMHVAAASGVHTIGIFGPTNEAATGPRGSKSHVVRAPGTKPVYTTEHSYSLGSAPHETLLKVTPTLVLDKILDIVAR